MQGVHFRKTKNFCFLKALVQSMTFEEIDSYYCDEFALWTEPYWRILLSKINASNQKHVDLFAHDGEVDNMLFSSFFSCKDEKPDV